MTEDFSVRLHRAPDFDAVRQAFDAHASGQFISRFFHAELAAIAGNPEHIVRRAAGQVSSTLINSPHFEYTIRLAPAFREKPKRVKWLGERQIIRLRGPGTASVRILRVPKHVSINRFRPGVLLRQMPARLLGDGDVIEVADGHGLIDIVSIDAPLILEFVTMHSHEVELYWTFDEQRRSAYAELAALNASRLHNIIELAHKMGQSVPEGVYGRLLSDRSTQIRLLAIQSMLVEQHRDAFRHLHEAIESPNPLLAMGGGAILDALTGRREQTGIH